MSAIKGSYYPPEIIDTDGNIENEGVYGKNTPFVSDDHMGIINLQGANIDYLKTAVDNIGSNTKAAQNQLQTNIDTNNTNQTNALNTVKTDLTNLINSNKSTQDAKNTAYDSHLSTLDSKTDTNASNITALQTSDNDKFKTATVSNATITLTKGTGETTSLTVNNVANATNASYTTTQAETDNSTKIASTAFVRTAVSNLVSSAPETLNTLNELATALGNDPNFATTVSKNIGAIDAKANTNASNITALQTSDNAKFKAVSVSNDTLTFTKGDNTTTAVTVNNVNNATNATNATYASIMHWDLGTFTSKTIADLRTTLMSAAISIGKGNTGYVYFLADINSVVSGWQTTTATITTGGLCTVRISNVETISGGYFHGTIYSYDVPEYTFSVFDGVWSDLNRNLVQSDYDTLNSAITTTNTNLSSLSSTVTSNKSAQDTKNSSYESRLTAVESKATTNETNISTLTTNATTATNATNVTETPSTTDNSTKIASTAFVNNYMTANSTTSTTNSTDDTITTTEQALVGKVSWIQKYVQWAITYFLVATTAYSSLLSNMNSNSLFVLALQKAFYAMGMRWDMSTNGYFAFGSLFNGLCIQWVNYSIGYKENPKIISYPLSINYTYCIAPSVTGSALNMIGSRSNNNNTFYICKQSSDVATSYGIVYIICSI